MISCTLLFLIIFVLLHVKGSDDDLFPYRHVTFESRYPNQVPQTFVAKDEWIALGPLRMFKLIDDLNDQGFSCNGTFSKIQCSPSIPFDSIGTVCKLIYWEAFCSKTQPFNRTYDYSYPFQFRSDSCSSPQVWKRIGDADINMKGQPMKSFLDELNKDGYDCSATDETLTCHNAIPKDTIKGHCDVTDLLTDPHHCHIDRIYNHFSLKKLFSCCFGKECEIKNK